MSGLTQKAVKVTRSFFLAATSLTIFCSFLANASSAAEFHDLVRAGDLRIIREMIARDKLLVNMKDEIGRSPLHIAVLSGHLAVVNVLIKAGAGVNDVERLKGQTPLHHAAFYNYPKIMLFLLSRGATVDVKDADGNSPLHFAAANGSRSTVEILLQHRAKADIYNKDWQTPLHFCAYAGSDRNKFFAASRREEDYLAVAEMLLTMGANARLRDIWQNTPETVAWQQSPRSAFPQKFSKKVMLQKQQ